jgi:uncharacterized membrane protein YfcA
MTIEPNITIIFSFLILLLCGSIGGFLAGLLGVGGGMLFIPVIHEYLNGYSLTTDEIVKYTLGNSIALVFISGVSGTFRQIKMGTWDWKQSLQIGIPAPSVPWRCRMQLHMEIGTTNNDSKPFFWASFC